MKYLFVFVFYGCVTLWLRAVRMYYLTGSVGQEAGLGWVGLSGKLQSRCWSELGPHLEAWLGWIRYQTQCAGRVISVVVEPRFSASCWLFARAAPRSRRLPWFFVMWPSHQAFSQQLLPSKPSKEKVFGMRLLEGQFYISNVTMAVTSSPLSRNYLASSQERQRPLQLLWIEVGYSYRHTPREQISQRREHWKARVMRLP